MNDSEPTLSADGETASVSASRQVALTEIGDGTHEFRGQTSLGVGLTLAGVLALAGCGGAQNERPATVEIPDSSSHILEVAVPPLQVATEIPPKEFVWNGAPCLYDTGLGEPFPGKWMTCQLQSFADPDKNLGDGQSYMSFRAIHSGEFPLLQQCQDIPEFGDPLVITFGKEDIWQLRCIAPADQTRADSYPFTPAQPDKGKPYGGSEGYNCFGQFMIDGNVHGFTSAMPDFNTGLQAQAEVKPFGNVAGTVPPQSFQNAPTQCRITFTGPEGSRAKVQVTYPFGLDGRYEPEEP